MVSHVPGGDKGGNRRECATCAERRETSKLLDLGCTSSRRLDVATLAFTGCAESISPPARLVPNTMTGNGFSSRACVGMFQSGISGRKRSRCRRTGAHSTYEECKALNPAAMRLLDLSSITSIGPAQ